MPADRPELSELAALLLRTRQGGGGALVVRGEAGIGKTWLLEQALVRIPEIRVVRATGVEFESELPYSALHQLTGPLLNGVDGLPAVQRDALRSAFGLGSTASAAPDPFLVGLAALTLLSQSTQGQALVCVLDDAQWLDRASAQALGFVARRVGEEGIAVLFAARDPEPLPYLTGLPTLTVGPFLEQQARDLLDRVLPAPVDARVRERILAEADGNPLAILELAAGAAPTEHAGGFAIPDLHGDRAEALFGPRLAVLPDDTRRLLTVAAAEPLGDPALLWQAAAYLDMTPETLDPAIAAGLIEADSRVRFRHPLVRAAMYAAAGPAGRRAAHAALAEVTDGVRDPDRQVWHQAQAAAGLDGRIADALVASAEHARSRGGVAAAAAFLVRAAELTPEPGRRTRRTLEAAALTLRAGAPQQALDLLRSCDLSRLSAQEQARGELLSGEVAFALQRGIDAPGPFRRAAQRLEALDARAARDAHIDAVHASLIVGHLGEHVLPAATAALARRPTDPPATADLLLDGVSSLLVGRLEAGASLLAEAFRDRADEVWNRRPALVAVSLDIWDLDAYQQILNRVVDEARRSGALTVLPQALGTLAGASLPRGDLQTAEVLLDEGDRLAEATGTAPLVYPRLHLLALRADATADQLIDQVTSDAVARGEGLLVAYAGFTRALLRNGLADYAGASAAAREAVDHLEISFSGLALRELVEAAGHVGERDVAVEAFDLLRRRTSAAGTAWARGIELGCAAFLAEDAEADAGYRSAITVLSDAGIDCDAARMRLLYGQWLRREGRRLEARAELREAHTAFTAMGVGGFATRAAAELLATGERVPRRTEGNAVELTAQEVRIARMVAEGMTTKEAAGALFLSPRTVDAHLRNIFRKLDIRSRRELRSMDLQHHLTPMS